MLEEKKQPDLSPDWIVCCTQVDEEVPGPVGHSEEVLHAAQVHGQQAGPAPDGGHPPGSDPYIWKPVSQ